MTDVKTVPSPGAGSQKTDKDPNAKKIEPAIVVALIGALATIIVAILAFPPLATWVNSYLTPSVTATALPALRTTETQTKIPISTDPFLFFPATETATPLSTVSPTLVFRVTVKLEVSRDNGKAPFIVNFNADDSKFQFAEGAVISCRASKSCKFIWNVYRNGKLFGEPFTTPDGHMAYKFTVRGKYLVAVTVCRDTACETDTVEIEAK